MKQPVLNVGQCGFDSQSIESMLQTQFGVEVVHVSTIEQSLTELRENRYALVLVNRILDATGEAGVNLISRISADPDINTTPVMLVSNYEQAQADAIEQGAVPGFGKSKLNASETTDLLRQYLN